MERGRPQRVRGGSWRRGGGGGGNDSESSGGEHRGRGRGGGGGGNDGESSGGEHRGRGRGGGGGGGNDGESSGGEHRGRGRGGHYRGRGKRDNYRGRGRGGGAPAASFHRGQDEGVDVDLEDEGMEVFSRRKLESNWDRYEASEKEEPSDDTPTLRGTDYHVLLESAGDSFTQFRFSEEKEWDMDSSAASQMSAVFVDLPALAQSLQELPLHLRLNLEAELVQVSTPVELPTMTVAPKQDLAKVVFNPPATAFKGLNASLGVSSATTSVSGTTPQASSGAAKPPEDDNDEELDQLLSFQRPVSEASENQPVKVADEETAASDKSPKKIKEEVPEIQMEDEEEKEGPPPKPAAVKQEDPPPKPAAVKQEDPPPKPAAVKQEDPPPKPAAVKQEDPPPKPAAVKQEDPPSKPAAVKQEDLPPKPAAVKQEDPPPKPAAVKQKVTEEDLEDWLDSMIS